MAQLGPRFQDLWPPADEVSPKAGVSSEGLTGEGSPAKLMQAVVGRMHYLHGLRS